ncbi:hypothetical protein DTO207G8_3557 [Paecilomyces variotii]|nr:hypothetical protein DTO207G8_3557 [Paecilomyces variotii]
MDKPPAVIDFSKEIRHNLNWYNMQWNVPPDLFTKNRKRLQQHRGGKLTLHGFQAFSEEMVCVLNYGGPDLSERLLIPSTSDATLRFSIRGGTEIPHFHVSLQLKHPNDERRNLSFSLVWTAWDPQGFDNKRNPATKESPNPSIAFSSRLTSVTFASVQHIAQSAQACQAQINGDCYQINWFHYAPPICYGFDVPETALSGFHESQIQTLNLLRGLTRSERSVHLRTRARAGLYDNWRLMSEMPQRTPPPYPLYDCTYDVHTGEFGVIRDIPTLADNNIQLHHRRRQMGWPNQPPKFDTPQQILSFTPNAPVTFINEREYEAIKTIGLLREANYRQRNYVKSFNRYYEFDLWPVSLVHGTQTPVIDEYFYGVLGVDVTSDSADDEQVLPLPEPGTPVVIAEGRCASQLQESTLSNVQVSDENRWTGVVVASPKVPDEIKLPANMICIRIRQPRRLESVGRILKLAGWATFGNPNTLYKQIRTAIRYAMYGSRDHNIPRDNKLKRLLLGHDNNVIKLHPRDGHLDQSADVFVHGITQKWNHQQVDAIRSALTIGDSYRSFMTLVTGPPGTGKTTVLEGIARYCYKEGHPLLIVHGSNFGLDVIARRIALTFPKSQPPLETSRIYRLGTDFHETSEMQMAPGALNQSSLESAEFDAARRELLQLGIQPELLRVIKQSVQDMVSANSDLSLGSRIISRMERAAQLGSDWPRTTNEEREEMALIWNYFTWQKCLLREGIAFAEPVSASGETNLMRAGAGTDRSEEDAQPLHASFVRQLRRAWTDLQEFYLGHAKIILCTASTASRKSLRYFRPAFVLVEEASQIPESTCLNAISRYISSLRKVILSGDVAQLPPTVISLNMNEAYSSEKVSLLQRMLQSGVPDVQLTVQYRMSPDIANFISAEYYEMKLVNNPSYKQSQLSDKFSSYMAQRYQCSAGTSFFVSVENSTVFRRRNGTSVFNPEYVSFIGGWVAWFCGLGCPQEHILILSFYNDERRILADLMRKLGFKDVKISSVDAAQGDESPIVILSTTRPGRRYGLGFVQDRQRQCVALSRARDALLVVGDERMHETGKPGAGQGFLAWRNVVDYHRQSGRLIKVMGSSTMVEQNLGVPNDDYDHAISRLPK